MKFFKKVCFLLLLILLVVAIFYFTKFKNEKKILEEIISRLSAETRVAEVVVEKKEKDTSTNKIYTTIKFVEYDTKQRPLAPKYFTFSTDIIHFKTLVIRFDDFYIKKGDPLKGKSAYIFMQVFAIPPDKKVEIFDINKAYQVPSGYKIENVKSSFEEKLWKKFWEYALNREYADKEGIKNAQIEAPATKFIPGLLYILKIEHDGGLRIDVKNLNNPK